MVLKRNGVPVTQYHKRYRKVLLLRERDRMKFRDIGVEIGVSYQRAAQLYTLAKKWREKHGKR